MTHEDLIKRLLSGERYTGVREEAAKVITDLEADMDGMIDQHIVMRKDWKIAELEQKLAALQLVVDQAEHALLPLPGCDYLATKTADTPLPCNCFKSGGQL